MTWHLSAKAAICLLNAGCLLGLVISLSACGGSSDSMAATPQSGLSAVMNGATHATATTHWESTNCPVKVELTSDHRAWTAVTDRKGTTSSGAETWSVGANQNSVLIGPGDGGLGGFYWVSALGNISGSIASKAFTATTTVETGSTSQGLGSCTFAVAQHPLS